MRRSSFRGAEKHGILASTVHVLVSMFHINVAAATVSEQVRARYSRSPTLGTPAPLCCDVLGAKFIIRIIVLVNYNLLDCKSSSRTFL